MVLRGNVGWLDLLEESKRGKIHEMTGFIVGSDAQIMPVLTSMFDQIAASVLAPKFPVNKVLDLGFKDLDLQVISSDIDTMYRL